MVSKQFNFDSPGGYSLSGLLEIPDMAPRGWAIFAHCFTCGKNSLAASRVSRALAKIGIGALRFDFAGLGASGGRFAQGGFAADARDLIAAANAMQLEGFIPGLLVGHSLGGAAALVAAADMPTIRAVATIGAPSDITHVLNKFDPASLAAVKDKGEAEVQLGGRSFVVSKRFVDGLANFDMATRIVAMHRPLLILHSPRDEVVSIDHARRIFGIAKHPKSFVSLDDADHLLTRQADADFVAKAIACWAERYLLPPIAERAPTDETKEVFAVETGAGKFQLEIRAAGMRMLADEPISAGGLGSGPSPYDLLSAALAACTTMTIRLYANQKKWPLARIETSITHSKMSDRVPKDVFSRAITIQGPLDEEQRQALLSIAERCPVHRTLVEGATVGTVLNVAS
jgi:putative redox protein